MDTSHGKPDYVDLDTGNTFAYYYPDNHPSLFVAFLGAGRQGAAILVRSVFDGKLYVRKRDGDNLTRSFAGEPVVNPALNAIPHANICQLISQTKLHNTRRPWESTYADLWQFYAGGSLGDFILSYQDRNEPIPEAVIWRLIRDLLSAIIHLHDHNVSHSDLIQDNVFVNWPALPSSSSGYPSSPTTSLPSPPSSCSSPSNSPPQPPSLNPIPPTFIIGDFGASFTLPPNATTTEKRGFASTSEAVEHDLNNISRILQDATKPTSPTTTSSYSPSLLSALSQIARVPHLLHKFNTAQRHGANGEMYARVLDPLLVAIDRGIADADRACGTVDFSAVHPRQGMLEGAAPLMYHSREALVGMGWRPPGPWCVAELRGVGGGRGGGEGGGVRLARVDLEKRYCEDEAMVTMEEGRSGRWVEADREEVMSGWREACWGRWEGRGEEGGDDGRREEG